MSKWWLNRQSDDEAAAPTESYWAAMREDLDASAFWVDRIKECRDEPSTRLQAAMDKLPLPAAFREAAVALRAIIRGKRKAKEPYKEELGLLYWLAALESFMLPYADKLKEPGFNVIKSIPGNRLRALPVEYQQVGYEKLGLLNQADIEWIVEAWGKPEKHQTLNQVHRALWDEYEAKLVQTRQAKSKGSALEL